MIVEYELIVLMNTNNLMGTITLLYDGTKF